MSFLSSGDLPNPGLEHTSPVSPALVGRFFIMDPPNIYTMEDYLVIQKNEILPFATTWMGLEGIMVSEISQLILYPLL